MRNAALQAARALGARSALGGLGPSQARVGTPAGGNIRQISRSLLRQTAPSRNARRERANIRKFLSTRSRSSCKACMRHYSADNFSIVPDQVHGTSITYVPHDLMGCKLVGTVKGTKLWAGDCAAPSERSFHPREVHRAHGRQLHRGVKGRPIARRRNLRAPLCRRSGVGVEKICRAASLR
jgi:hypothetical protein